MTPDQALEHPWIKGNPKQENPRLSTASFGEVKNLTTSKDFSTEMMECESDSPTMVKRIPRAGVACKAQNSKKLLKNQISTMIGSSLLLNSKKRKESSNSFKNINIS